MHGVVNENTDKVIFYEIQDVQIQDFNQMYDTISLIR